MKNNRLIIAAAGSGKTTHIINEAMKSPDEKVLITTYTIENENEIRDKIFAACKCIPKNITIQTWFSFLIKHGIKPYQGTYNSIMFNEHIAGLNFVSSRSGAKYDPYGNQLYSNGHPVYYPEDNFKKHYFTKKMKIYSDKLSKFVVLANKASNGEVINRISRIYSKIYIDEVQDLAGYDLELIKTSF
jgi:DNA helicase-2/ATP-dependent DNA helicase PcrA